MVNNRAEYERMHDLERNLWWYRSLHDKILHQISRHFGKTRDLAILDAGCGTGGMLAVLRENGYDDLAGFDFSQDAIELSVERGLDVSFGDLRQVEEFRPEGRYDVIICNDALYILNDEEMVRALAAFRQRLKPNGLILVNVHAFDAFAGTHDVVMNSPRRYRKKMFEQYTHRVGLKLSYATYWPFFLALPIWLVRRWQRHQLKTGKIDLDALESDVQYPGDSVNRILRFLTDTEHRIIRRAPVGSSLFMVMKAA
ncbi:class I SAM-dependent methyltransferase [Persicitalea sp.]|uniref:class I SAM-dependent DNA methyltransferase n=1 Tax=Persicitalea sp. TaxID=3100273 RepID=UPI00359335CB